MNKRQLALAQFLFDTYERAEKLADERDPKRKRDNEVTRKLDAIATNASHAFLHLTGRHVINVKTICELSTENPAAWTKTARGFDR